MILFHPYLGYRITDYHKYGSATQFFKYRGVRESRSKDSCYPAFESKVFIPKLSHVNYSVCLRTYQKY